jgi:hypothetical protein
MYGASLEVE